jgi:hypothetical protein
MATYNLTAAQLKGTNGEGILNSFEIPAGGSSFNAYSVNFDGTDDYVDCGNDSSLQPTDEFSVSAWFKTDVVGDSGRNFVFSKVFFRLDIRETSGRLEFAVYRSTGQGTFVYTPSGTSYSDGNWHHVVATFKKSDINRYKIYVDGALKAEATGYNNNVYASSHAFQIGVNNGANYMDGNIDEVAFWDKALSASEAADVYNGGVPGDLSSMSNLTNWWRMGDINGKSGVTIEDQGSEGADGTLVNGPTYSSNVPT